MLSWLNNLFGRKRPKTADAPLLPGAVTSSSSIRHSTQDGGVKATLEASGNVLPFMGMQHQQHAPGSASKGEVRWQGTPPFKLHTPNAIHSTASTADGQDVSTPEVQRWRFSGSQTAGIDNTVARYKESRPVLPHATPFERRVERALLEEEEVVRDIVCSDRLTDKRIKARRA